MNFHQRAVAALIKAQLHLTAVGSSAGAHNKQRRGKRAQTSCDWDTHLHHVTDKGHSLNVELVGEWLNHLSLCSSTVMMTSHPEFLDREEVSEQLAFPPACWLVASEIISSGLSIRSWLSAQWFMCRVWCWRVKVSPSPPWISIYRAHRRAWSVTSQLRVNGGSVSTHTHRPTVCSDLEVCFLPVSGWVLFLDVLDHLSAFNLISIMLLL